MLSSRITQDYINNKIYNAFAKQLAALQQDALAVFVVQHDFPGRQAPDEGKMYRKYFIPKLRPNFFYISEQLATSIMGGDYDLAKSGSMVSKSYNTEIRISLQKKTDFKQGIEVLGWLEGSDLKEQLLVISAHYDHLGKKDP
jgi:hypothetical protein